MNNTESLNMFVGAVVTRIKVGGKYEIVKRIARVASVGNGDVNRPVVKYAWQVRAIGGQPLSESFSRLADAKEFIRERETGSVQVSTGIRGQQRDS